MPLALAKGSFLLSVLSDFLSIFSEPRPSPSPRVLASGSALGCSRWAALWWWWWWCLLGGMFSESGFSCLEGAEARERALPSLCNALGVAGNVLSLPQPWGGQCSPSSILQRDPHAPRRCPAATHGPSAPSPREKGRGAAQGDGGC